LGTARSTFAGSQGGLGTAGIVAGGQTGSPTATNTIEFWNVTDTSTGSLSHFKADTIVTEDMTVGSFTDTNLMPYQSSSFRSHTNKPHIIPYVGDQYYDTRRYLPTGSGNQFSCGSCAAEGSVLVGIRLYH
jgi:hypothetical protein